MTETGTNGGGAFEPARGHVATGFEPVRLSSSGTLRSGVYWRGEKVVDLCGGRRSGSRSHVFLYRTPYATSRHTPPKTPSVHHG